MKFSGRLAFLLGARRMTQIALATALGANQANVSRWLKGSTPERRFVVPLAKRLNVSVDWLLHGIGIVPSEAEAFIDEVRVHQLPAIEASIERLSNQPDKQRVQDNIDLLQSLRSGLRLAADRAEKEGVVVYPRYLEHPKYVSQSRELMMNRYGDGIVVMPMGSGRISPSEVHAMICTILDLDPLASDSEIRAAYDTFIAERRAKKKVAQERSQS